jgi:glycosyltransferase involved in cell wall biosynthesis
MRWRRHQGGKLIFDLIDPYLAIPMTDPKQLFRGIAWFAKGRHRYPTLNFRATLEGMCRRADAVVCTTEEQQQAIERLCRNTHIVLDLQDEILGSVKLDYSAQRPFRIVWEGLPSNIYQLRTIRTALQQVSHRYPLKLIVVTDPDQPRTVPWLGRVKTLDVLRQIFDNVDFRSWDKATWSDIITDCDLAVIPIELDRPLYAGKPGNKLALFWRAGMPVVASATPAYVRMLRAAGLETLACFSTQDWITALETMINNEQKRREAGLRGRDFVARALSTDALLQSWDRVMSSVGINVADSPRDPTGC